MALQSSFQIALILVLFLSPYAYSAVLTITFDPFLGIGDSETRTLELINTLGPTVIISDHSSTNVTLSLNISAVAGGESEIDAIIANQPIAPTLSLDEKTFTYSFNGSGTQDRLVNGLTYTPPPNASLPSTATVAILTVTVPPVISQVCVNTYCASPLFWPVPEETPKTLSSIGDVVYDSLTGLEWQSMILTGKNYTFSDDSAAVMREMQSDCAEIGPGWRVPTRFEMVSIMNHRGGGAVGNGVALNTTLFPNDGSFSRYAWWTSTRTLVNPNFERYYALYAWDGGISYNGDVNVNAREVKVRCVRTVVNKREPEGARWLTLDEERVLDKWTLLEWQVEYSKEQWKPPSNAPAVAYCETLKNRWTLPHFKQLASHHDEKFIQPVWNTTVFPKINPRGSSCCGCQWASTMWWSSRTWSAGTHYWIKYSSDGVMYIGDANPKWGINCHARCVRTSILTRGGPRDTPDDYILGLGKATGSLPTWARFNLIIPLLLVTVLCHFIN